MDNIMKVSHEDVELDDYRVFLDNIDSESLIHLELEELPFQVTEAINTLRANIQLSGLDIKVVGVTSSIEHLRPSGKTHSVYGL